MLPANRLYFQLRRTRTRIRTPRKPHMSILLRLRHEGSIAIAGVRGSLTLSPTLRGFKKQIERSFTDATRGLVLDLAEVPEMDSAGIGELVALYSSAKRRG